MKTSNKNGILKYKKKKTTTKNTVYGEYLLLHHIKILAGKNQIYRFICTRIENCVSTLHTLHVQSLILHWYITPINNSKGLAYN